MAGKGKDLGFDKWSNWVDTAEATKKAAEKVGDADGVKETWKAATGLKDKIDDLKDLTEGLDPNDLLNEAANRLESEANRKLRELFEDANGWLGTVGINGKFPDLGDIGIPDLGDFGLPRPPSFSIEPPSAWKGVGFGGGKDAPGSGRANLQTVHDPEGAYIFALEIDGIEIAQFMECSGLKTSTKVYELEEGGMNHMVHKLPGQSRWENIVLRYGVSNDTTLMEWRDQILSGDFTSGSRKNGSIVMKNNQMDVVRRYNFQGAWPVSWEGPKFSSANSAVAVEMIELAHHGIYVS